MLAARQRVLAALQPPVCRAPHQPPSLPRATRWCARAAGRSSGSGGCPGRGTDPGAAGAGAALCPSGSHALPAELPFFFLAESPEPRPLPHPPLTRLPPAPPPAEPRPGDRAAGPGAAAPGAGAALRGGAASGEPPPPAPRRSSGPARRSGPVCRAGAPRGMVRCVTALKVPGAIPAFVGRAVPDRVCLCSRLPVPAGLLPPRPELDPPGRPGVPSVAGAVAGALLPAAR